MVAIFEKESKFFQRVPGGYFAIFGGVFFSFALLVAVILHSLTEPVSMFQHFVSNMGIGPNGAPLAFSVGLLVIAACLYPLVIHASQLLWMDASQPRAKWNNRLVLLAFVIAMFAIPGMIIIAFFSMAPETILWHAVGAILFFGGTMMYGALYWICIELHKDATRLLRICTAVVFGFFAAFMGALVSLMMQYPEEFAAFLADPMAAISALLGNTTDTKLGWIRFFEWWLILSMVAWNFCLGVFAVQIARRNRSKIAPNVG